MWALRLIAAGTPPQVIENYRARIRGGTTSRLVVCVQVELMRDARWLEGPHIGTGAAAQRVSVAGDAVAFFVNFSFF